jgi:hypothetical protein
MENSIHEEKDCRLFLSLVERMMTVNEICHENANAGMGFEQHICFSFV